MAAEDLGSLMILPAFAEDQDWKHDVYRRTNHPAQEAGQSSDVNAGVHCVDELKDLD